MSFNHMPMLGKILALLAMLGLVSIGTVVFATSKMRSINDRYSEMIASPEKGILYLARSNRKVIEVISSIYTNTASTTPEANLAAAQERDAARAAFNDLIAKAKVKLPDREDDIKAIEVAMHQALDITCSQTITLANSSAAAAVADNAEASHLMSSTCKPALMAVSASLTKLVDKISSDLDKGSDAATAVTNGTIALTYGSVVTGLLLIMGCAFWLTRTGIVVPLGALTNTMEAMSKGQLDVTVPGQDRKDELGGMAKTAEIFRKGLIDAETLRDVNQASQKAETERLLRQGQAVERFVGRMGDVSSSFVRSSSEVSEAAQSLSSTAEETSRQAQIVSGAAEEASTNVQTAAAATEEMAMSVKEINQQVTRAAQIAEEAASEAARTETEIRGLSEAANGIGEVVNLINDIASQTNLLALNATIEAARAGEAGKGFAVVASEVKALATQTARATQDIGSKIAEIQNATGRTVGSIERIVVTITDMRGISASIASAVEQQGAATNEISNNTSMAASGTSQVTENIFGVGRAAEMTGAASSQLMGLAGSLTQQASDLQREVDDFVQELRAG